MNHSLHQVVIEADENPCHTTESFFTWDALRGINLDILLLLVDGVLLFLLLVLIESKALARLWFGQLRFLSEDRNVIIPHCVLERMLYIKKFYVCRKMGVPSPTPFKSAKVT